MIGCVHIKSDPMGLHSKMNICTLVFLYTNFGRSPHAFSSRCRPKDSGFQGLWAAACCGSSVVPKTTAPPKPTHLEYKVNIPTSSKDDGKLTQGHYTMKRSALHFATMVRGFSFFLPPATLAFSNPPPTRVKPCPCQAHDVLLLVFTVDHLLAS